LQRAIIETVRWLLEGKDGEHANTQFVLGGLATQYPRTYRYVGAIHQAVAEIGDGTLSAFPNVELLLRAAFESSYNYYLATAGLGKRLPIQAIQDYTHSIFFEYREQGAMDALSLASEAITLVQSLLRACASRKARQNSETKATNAMAIKQKKKEDLRSEAADVLQTFRIESLLKEEEKNRLSMTESILETRRKQFATVTKAKYKIIEKEGGPTSPRVLNMRNPGSPRSNKEAFPGSPRAAN